MILCIIGVGLVLFLSICFGMASVYSTIVAFWDMFSLLMILVPTGLILVAAGRWKSFFLAFAIIVGKRGKYTIQQMREAKQALKQGANSFLTVGILESLATVILLMGNYTAAMLQEHFLANMAVALLCFLYGLVAYLLLLPIRSRLEIEIEKHN